MLVREVYRDRLGVTGLHPLDASFQLVEKAVVSKLHLSVLCGELLQGLLIHLDREAHRSAVTIGGRSHRIRLAKVGVLLLQVLETMIDRFIRHSRRFVTHLQPIEAHRVDGGAHLEGCYELERLTIGQGSEVAEVGLTHDGELVLFHRMNQSRLHQALRDLGAHLLSEQLLENVARHFPWSETTHLRSAAQVREALVEVLGDAIPRDLHFHLYLDGADLTDLGLHHHSPLTGPSRCLFARRKNRT